MFYEESLNAVKEAIKRFDQDAIPYKRPADYYAEMVKPDSHMARIKDVLVREQKKMAFVEQRKKARLSSKLHKEVQSQKRDERNKEKKKNSDNLERIKKKGRQNNRELRAPRTKLSREDDSKVVNKQQEARRNSGSRKSGGQVNKKRQHADEKYGYGGAKRHKKSNTGKQEIKILL